MSTAHPLKLTVNGKTCERAVEPRTTLADFLRHELGLTGTHIGCEHGVCGACTVLVDSKSTRGCLMFAVQAEGAEVRTVESLGTPDKLNPLQQAFTRHHALQCGFCTPGILMTLTEYLENRKPGAPLPSETEIREVLSGNICRCTGYQYIVDAALEAVAALKEAK